jgi:hypothetical protein
MDSGPGIGGPHPAYHSTRKTKNRNMKKGVTIISILVAIGAAVVFFVGGHLSGKPETETRWKGEPLEVGKVAPRLPEWRVLVIWEKAPAHSREGTDVAGPAPYYVFSKAEPTLETIKATLPPFPRPGEWTPVVLFSTELVREGYPPEAEPTKPENPK